MMAIENENAEVRNTEERKIFRLTICIVKVKNIAHEESGLRTTVSSCASFFYAAICG